MDQQQGKADGIRKLGKLMKGIKVAMLTTAESDGALRSRPMMVQDIEFDGDLWFFTSASSPKVREMQQASQVNVSFAAPDDQRYVSVSGMATLVRDRKKIEELWNPLFKAWFPNGVDDPDLALLKVNVTQAEYWDSPAGKMVAIAGFVKALVTGERIQGGENEKLNLGQ